MQYIPAIDGALTQLVTSLHDVVKHDIAGKECTSCPRYLDGFGLFAITVEVRR